MNNLTTHNVNRDFKIKVNGYHRDRYVSKLVGKQGLVNIIGMDHARNFIERAYRQGDEKVVCRLRRGI
jgi:hypothetical protein